jgi:hypothetical protein
MLGEANMKTKSHEALCCTAILVLLGILAICGGAGWLSLLIPAAVLLWLVANIRCQRPGIDLRVDNRPRR